MVDVSPEPLRGQLLRRIDVLAALPVGVLLIAAVYYWLLTRETTLHTVLAKTAEHPGYQVALVILVPITFVLFALNFSLLGVLVRARAAGATPAGSLAGAIIGGFGASCPSCGAFLLSVVGVSAGLSVLPFAGLEFWVAGIFVMAYTLARSMRRLRTLPCRVLDNGKSCVQLPSVSAVYLAAIALIGVVSAAALILQVTLHEPA